MIYVIGGDTMATIIIIIAGATNNSQLLSINIVCIHRIDAYQVSMARIVSDKKRNFLSTIYLIVIYGTATYCIMLTTNTY